METQQGFFVHFNLQSMVWRWEKGAFYLLTFEMETLVWIQRSGVDADLK